MAQSASNRSQIFLSPLPFVFIFGPQDAWTMREGRLYRKILQKRKKSGTCRGGRRVGDVCVVCDEVISMISIC
jgi:hypothetical protein